MCNPTLGPLPEIVTVRSICIAMLSSKVFIPSASEPCTLPLTNAEALEPAPDCGGETTFAALGNGLGFARSIFTGFSEGFGSSDTVSASINADAVDDLAIVDA